MRIEVRCCCNASKLLGTMEWPTVASRSARFPLRVLAQRSAEVKFESVLLTLATYNDGRGSERHAVKADGVPIETLRRVVGFREHQY